MFHLIVRGGMVVDGSGAPATRADVAVDGGKIVAIGRDLGDAAQVVDASGCVVSPGFIDVHTHLDAQLFWDSAATPSCFHGVTSVVIGNCGFGVAPFVPGTADYVLRTLERVEEIPLAATKGAVPFTWESFPEYLDAIDALDLGVNVAAFVPHSALRHSVMRERASVDVADEADLRLLERALREALEAGGVGLATSRARNQHDALGGPIPSRTAGDDELARLMQCCADRVWQVNLESKYTDDAEAMIAEIERWVSWSDPAGARLTWTPFLVHRAGRSWRRVLEHNHDLAGASPWVRPQVIPLPITVAAGFDGPCATVTTQNWTPALGEEFWSSSVAHRLQRLSDPRVRSDLAHADLLEETALPPVEEWIVSFCPSSPENSGARVGDLDDGRGPIDTMLDIVVDDGLQTLIQVPVTNMDDGAVEALVADEHTMVGLGDAGAHVQSISTYTYPTYLLARFVRDRGVLTLEAAVHQLSGRPAEYCGLQDRGTIRVGSAADLCVFDLATLDLAPVEVRADLPEATPRLYQQAVGITCVIVNGQITIQDGRRIGGSTPGVVLRR